MRYAIRGVVLAGLLVLAAGCDHGPSGKYTAQTGMSIEFKSGKATVTDPNPNAPVETDDYTVEGNTITLKSKSGGDVKLTIMQDGSIEGGVFGTFKKAAS